MKKLLVIVWRELYARFSDRNLLLIMIAAPLAIASIVGLAFGGVGGGASPIQNIPVALVNLDAGAQDGADFGGVLSDVLLGREPQPAGETGELSCPLESSGEPAQARGDTELDDLLEAEVFDLQRARSVAAQEGFELPDAQPGSPEFKRQAVRAAVDHGAYRAAVIIPESYSADLLALADASGSSPAVQVEVYGNRGQQLSATIVRSVVEAVTNQFASGSIAVGVTVSEIAQRDPGALQTMGAEQFQSLIGCAFRGGQGPARLDSQPVQPAAQENQTGLILVAVGSAQAMFFALFTGQFGVLSMHEERKDGTLQRMLVTPTPRATILGGKLAGVMASVLFQLLALMAALTLVGSLLSGELLLIWGADWGRLGALVLAVAVAVGGLSMLLAGAVRSIEQANVFATVVNLALGVLGGAFGFEMPAAVASFSLIHWGREAFLRLAAGGGDIGTHLLVLAAQGVVAFAVGLILFKRRFEV